MAFDRPLQISKGLLSVLGTRWFVEHRDRVPKTGAVIVVSNHRSFMDAPLLMSAIDRPIRFACHHYMGQVPIMREIVTELGGCFPLEDLNHRQHSFFEQASDLLRSRQVVGIFPEGTPPMIHLPPRDQVGTFHRGFAHLALKLPFEDVAVLPVAIASQRETVLSAVPLRWLSFFDASEPLFHQPGWHPMVLYQRVNLLIGHPIWITSTHREKYHGKDARAKVRDLSDRCRSEIAELLRKGCR